MPGHLVIDCLSEDSRTRRGWGQIHQGLLRTRHKGLRFSACIMIGCDLQRLQGPSHDL